MDIKNIIDKVLSSGFFSTSLNKASRITNNSVGILNLLKTVLTKIDSEGKSSVLKSITSKLLLLVDMVKSYAGGKYRDIETKNIVLVLASLIYLVSPIDLLPDILPFVGFADDVALISFVFNALSTEIEKFELWKMNVQN